MLDNGGKHALVSRNGGGGTDKLRSTARTVVRGIEVHPG